MVTETAIHAGLPNAGLPAPPWQRIGHGVWGDIFDLGDGSVLKLVRHHGGIGSGRDILFGEVRALDLLRGLTRPVTTAALHGFGEIDADAPALEGFCGWIRMGRLPGVTASALLADTRSRDDRITIMRRIGEAAGQFHQQSGSLVPEGAGLPDLTARRLSEITDIVPDMGVNCERVGAVLHWADPHPFLHGDINGGNVLFADPAAPATSALGLIDLGEAQCGVTEIELRHLHDFAGCDARSNGMAAALIEGYAATTGHTPRPELLTAAYCLNTLGTLAIARLGTVPGLDESRARQAAMAALAKLG